MAKDLVSIGALAKMVGLMPDTLRYYDEIGLIKPVQILRETGDRYYAPTQAGTLLRILELKKFGFSLKEIKAALTKDAAQLKEMYRLKYAELMRQNVHNQKITERLSQKINQREENMNKKVLIVDDTAFMRTMLTDLLTQEGYEVSMAEDGVLGLQIYEKMAPDVVILNVVMPNKDGIETLKDLPNANVVMLTALTQTATVAETLKGGARDFIAKPFMSERLIQAIQESFTKNVEYNLDYLEQLYEYGKQNSDTLSQAEIDNIMLAARNLDTVAVI
ncbi:MAG: response regulator [Turicibacter sp.]|nr:response regulator [Turicibacter sp.]